MSDLVKIGKYQILEQVGEGAMGVVYKAIDPVLNRPVAVKVMSEGMAQDDSLRERFLREAQAAGSLQHPNVVTIYDFGETDGHLFIAMEFIEGSDLEQLLTSKKALPLVSKLDIIIDVLNGLSYAHRRGIVHRDIKPANIRIDAEGHARIMDFGVVHLASSNLTGTGIMMGTPNYMAPENITGGEVSAASDLFSVGAVLYELLTNRRPFEADTLHRVLFRIVSDPPPDLLEMQPDLPPALDRIIKKALAKDLDVRYSTANEMANDLSAVRMTLGAPRASRTVSQRSSIEASLRKQRKALEGRPVRRWQVVSGVAAVLVFAMGGWLTLSGWPTTATTAEGVAAAGAPVAPETQAVAPIPAPDTQRAAAPPATPPQGTPTRPALTREAPERAASEPRVQTPQPERAAAVRTSTVTPPAPSPVAQGEPQGARAADQRTTAAPPPVPNSPARDSQPQPIAAPTEARPAADTTPARPAAPSPPEIPPARPAISSIMSAYARAIGTRDIDEVKRVYPGMTPAQESAWESFFSSVRSMTATFEIATLQVSGTNAVAHLSGEYEFVNRAGRSERQPASFDATFRAEDGRWQLREIR